MWFNFFSHYDALEQIILNFTGIATQDPPSGNVHLLGYGNQYKLTVTTPIGS